MTDDALAEIRTPLEHLVLVKMNGRVTASGKKKHEGRRQKSRQEVLVIMMDVKVLLHSLDLILHHSCITQRLSQAASQFPTALKKLLFCQHGKLHPVSLIFFVGLHQVEPLLEPCVRNVAKFESLNAPAINVPLVAKAWAEVTCKWIVIP